MDRTICFLVLPHVHLLDLSGPVQVFYEASRFDSGKYNILYCGIRKQELSEQGLELAGLTPINEIKLNQGDFIFVPGIDFAAFDKGVFNHDVAAIKPWLHQLSKNNVNVASICSGSLILADVGLLNNRKATSHWKCIEFMREHYPKINVQTDRLFVKDGNVFTSAGMTSGIDMALSIVEHHHGPIVAAKVA
jgi:transcriptional regulator GlxA family with amidase domain